MIAYRWAIARGKDAVRVTEFAENIYKERQGKPISIEALEVHLQHFTDATGRAADAWSRYATESWTHQTNWAIETVKHLAITNVAGIAGAAALLAGGKPFNEDQLKIAIISFTLGLLMTLVDFCLVSNGYWRRATDQQQRSYAIKNSSSWSEYISSEPEYTDKGKRWFTTAGYVGWTSAIGAIIGGIMLGTAILATKPATIESQQNGKSYTDQVVP